MAKTYPPAFEREVVGDLKVIKDEVFESPVSQSLGRFVPIHGIRVLTLEDDTVVHGCRDCAFTDPSPGKVRGHRSILHGLAEEGARPKPPKVEGGVGQVRAPGPDALAMTLHELLDVAGSIERLGLATEALDAENEALRAQLMQEKKTHREELAELRRTHREEIAELKNGYKTTEKELAAIKGRLKKLIGED